MATYVLIDAAPHAVQSAALLIAQGRAVDLPPKGAGYLSGVFPDGITRVEGVPASCTVRVLYRPGGDAFGDGLLFKQVQSAVDGTWLVDGLDPSLKYDVVCRHEGYNDSIYSNVTPATA